MRINDDLKVRRLVEASADQVPRCEILVRGVPSGKFIPGAILEAAVQWDSCHLLFVTDDVPFEEFLRIVLLDAELNVLDSARLGGIYSTGSFSSLSLREPDEVLFRFIGGSTWSVRLLRRPAWRVPFISKSRGVDRPLGFRRRFTVAGSPIPEIR